MTLQSELRLFFFLTWSPVSGILCWCTDLFVAKVWKFGGVLSPFWRSWMNDSVPFMCPLYSGNPHLCCVEPLEARCVGESWTLPSKCEQSKIACSDLAPEWRWFCTECLPLYGGGCLADACVCLTVTVRLISRLTVTFMDNQRSSNFYGSSHVSFVAAFWSFLQCQVICCGFCLTSCIEPLPFLFPLSIDLDSALQGLFSGNLIFWVGEQNLQSL